MGRAFQGAGPADKAWEHGWASTIVTALVFVIGGGAYAYLEATVPPASEVVYRVAVPCQILEHEVRPRTRPDGRPTWRVHLKTRWTAGQKTRTSSTRWWYHWRLQSKATPAQLLKEFPIGATVRCFHNPGKPGHVYAGRFSDPSARAHEQRRQLLQMRYLFLPGLALLLVFVLRSSVINRRRRKRLPTLPLFGILSWLAIAAAASSCLMCKNPGHPYSFLGPMWAGPLSVVIWIFVIALLNLSSVRLDRLNRRLRNRLNGRYSGLEVSITQEGHEYDLGRIESTWSPLPDPGLVSRDGFEARNGPTGDTELDGWIDFTAPPAHWRWLLSPRTIPLLGSIFSASRAHFTDGKLIIPVNLGQRNVIDTATDAAELTRLAKGLQKRRNPNRRQWQAMFGEVLEFADESFALAHLAYILEHAGEAECSRLVTEALKTTHPPEIQLALARTSPDDHRNPLEQLVANIHITDRIRVSACIALWDVPTQTRESAEDMLVALLVTGLDDDALSMALEHMGAHGERASMVFLSTEAGHLDNGPVNKALNQIKARRSHANLGGLSVPSQSDDGGLSIYAPDQAAVDDTEE